jgi:hypothetical protein
LALEEHEMAKLKTTDIAKLIDPPAPAIKVFLTAAEQVEVAAYLARHGGKKGPAARAALLAMVRADNALHEGRK